MKTPLWIPSEERRQQANITRFMRDVNARHKLNIDSYSDLYKWSVENIPDFWRAVWDFVEIKASQPYKSVVADLSAFPGTQWVPGAKLNFAENLLCYRDEQWAFVFIGETQTSKRMTYAELYDSVARLSRSLAEAGVGVGDRVVGYMPNLIETVICMLAATSLGATWSSCATDIGPGAAIERLGQVEPKVMITADGYFYKGKVFDTLGHAAEVAGGIPSLQKVIVVSYVSERAEILQIPNAVHYEDFLSQENNLEIAFAQLPQHPVNMNGAEPQSIGQHVLVERTDEFLVGG